MTVTTDRARPGARFANLPTDAQIETLRDRVGSHGRCQGYDPDLFHPLSDGDAANPARRICQPCPVRDECLQLAIATNDQWAVMGGLTATERRQLVVSHLTQ